MSGEDQRDIVVVLISVKSPFIYCVIVWIGFYHKQPIKL